jgi:cytochrome o ubiquinol oxidase subunit II
VRFLRLLGLLPVFALLGGCDMVLMNPSGDVAVQERNLIIASTGLMLLIIVPVILATALFAWRYRASNTKAAYAPDWHHSTQLEVLIWTAPLLIIIALGGLTWISTHVLDPFRPVGRIDASRPVVVGTKPLEVDVVSLDWKWLFIYPEQGIATVNELAAPIDRPLDFHITSGTVMNTFFVPALAGQIYAMAGMETRLAAVINKVGTYAGYSGMYSGAGFSDMNFKFYGMEEKDFDTWVDRAKGADMTLDSARFMQLSKPSEKVRPQFYASIQPDLYTRIVNMCADPDKMCEGEMMAIDATGGVPGEKGAANREKLIYDGARLSEGNEGPGATFPASGRPPNELGTAPQGVQPGGLANHTNEGGSPDAAQGKGKPRTDGMPTDDSGQKETAPAQINPH